GLAAGIRGEDRRFGEHAEVLLPLLLGAGEDERHGREIVSSERRSNTGAAVVDLLHHEDVVETGEPEPAVFGGDLGVHQAQFPAFAADLRRVRAVLVQLLRDRDDALARELASGVDEALLLVSECEVHCPRAYPENRARAALTCPRISPRASPGMRACLRRGPVYRTTRRTSPLPAGWPRAVACRSRARPAASHAPRREDRERRSSRRSCGSAARAPRAGTPH